MSTVTDAIFFLHNGKVVKEMMLSEFDALLDGIFELEELKGLEIQAAAVQITQNLKIRGLVFFLLKFTPQGSVDPEWSVPINQLMQSAGRGPDLGAGPIRMVSKRQCNVPWHKENLWDPGPKTMETLAKAVQVNRLGIAESDDAWNASWEDEGADIPVITTPEPPVLTLDSEEDIPLLLVEPDPEPPVAAKSAQPSAESAALSVLKKEFDALKAASSVKLDRLQKERDQLKEKVDSIAETLKKQAKEHIENLSRDFQKDIESRESQITALKAQLESERKRYVELKEKHVEQAAGYQTEREELMERLEKSQEMDSEKLGQLKEAFRKEMDARIDAEVSRVNEQLAAREVELFYREEQLVLARDVIAQLKKEKQQALAESGGNILQKLENNEITFVAFHPGIGHLTVPGSDIGRYLDERTSYLSSRCNVSQEEFLAWQDHCANPVCRQVGKDGKPCGKPVTLVNQASLFVKGRSDLCDAHKPARG